MSSLFYLPLSLWLEVSPSVCSIRTGRGEKDRERMHREEQAQTLVRHGCFFWRGYFTGSGNTPRSSRDTVPDMEGD